jgi:hypothetical protein
VKLVVGGGDVGSGSELVGGGADLVGAGAECVGVLDLELEVAGAADRLEVELVAAARGVVVAETEAAVTVGVALRL